MIQELHHQELFDFYKSTYKEMLEVYGWDRFCEQTGRLYDYYV